MSKFQVGDRVVCVKADGNHGTHKWQIGETGTVVKVEQYCQGVPCAVCHDNAYDVLHDCGGLTEDGRGWWYYEHELELFNDAPSVTVDDLI